MSPPNDRRTKPDDDASINGMATQALLEGLATDVRNMGIAITATGGAVIRIEMNQKQFTDKQQEQDSRLEAIEVDFRNHQAEEKLWQQQQQNDLQKVADKVDLIAPLTKAHEQLLQQAKGAVVATKLLYTVLGILTGTAGTYLFHLISKAH